MTVPLIFVSKFVVMKCSFVTITAFILLNLCMNKIYGQPVSQREAEQQKWWKEAVVYQIYPRSFKDNDGDGIGDLKGIISRLDYIKSLGVTVIWLNPIYESPNDDNGYDVSDYRNIMREFGTMEDFDLLLKGLHARGIKLVMDLVVNHSSDEHRWFQESRSSRTSPYRNYYHWWDAERGKPPYRYSLFDVNHDAWRYDSLTDAYYLHYFSRKQPDLNWENPQVRKEVYAIMRFWADKGIDGFRLDAFQFVAKDTTWPVWPAGWEKHFMQYYAMGPHLHDYLQEMNAAVLSRYNVMSVAEGAGNSFADAHALVDADRKELDMAYAFDAVDIPKPDGYSLLILKGVFTRWDSAFEDKGWLAVFLSNHDQARMVSRFGNDSPEFREVSSKLLSTFILTMRGTPFYYNGDELGMTNPGFRQIGDYRDVAVLNEYKHRQQTGADLGDYIKEMAFSARDNGRTPMQWDASLNAGFSTGTPWIGVNPNYTTINVAAQDKDASSCLNYFRRLVQLRKDNPVLVYGRYKLLDADNPKVYAYTRTLGKKNVLVLLNFSATPAITTVKVPRNASLLIGNYPSASGPALQPYEARVYEIR